MAWGVHYADRELAEQDTRPGVLGHQLVVWTGH
jgi:hypothetical protein